MLPTRARRRQTVENEQRTYGLAEWAAALRARRTEEELAAGTRERKAGEAYFVVDGHHRVSVARYHDVPTVEAAVAEFHPKLPAASVLPMSSKS
jgi:ParB-like chromosome segregation protein Spo0J